MDIARKITSILQNLGFSELEIAFYMFVLKNPESSIYEISRQLGISKNKAYLVYADLESQGLVTSSSEGWRKKVIPSSLLNMAESMKKQSRSLGKMANSLKEINKYLPLMADSNTDTKIQQLASIDEIRGNYADLAEEEYDNILAYGGFDQFINGLGYEHERSFIASRVKRGKAAHGIFIGHGEYTNDIIKKDDTELRESLIINDKKLEKQWVNIFPETNKTVIWSENSDGIMEATVIESPQVARAHEAIFDSLWAER